MSLIAHRLEDYIETTRRLSSENLIDVQVIVDRIREMFEGGDEFSNHRTTPILDSPPTRVVAQTTESEQEAESKVALSVRSKGVQRKLVIANLTGNGFELAYADHPLNAFRLAISLKPNLAVTSLEFENLYNLKLTRAIHGVDATSTTPIVLLTSHSIDQMGEALPEHTRAINKDVGFDTKLTEAIQTFGI